jgi:hypothetical protein
MAGYIISPEEWAQFNDDINGFMELDSANQVFTWLKCVRSINPKGNDDTPLYKNYELQGLFQYNEFRSWPINADTSTGQIDKESILAFINNDYLQKLGLLTPEGQFNFNPALDKFIVNGVRYKSKGDSQTAQAHNKPLLHFMVLLRDYVETENERY